MSKVDIDLGTFVVYLAANVELTFSNNFVFLMIFRGIQAQEALPLSLLASVLLMHVQYSTNIVSGAGVIGDITTARDRGGLLGIFGGNKLTHLKHSTFH
jgi:hypothetical protein